MEAKENSFEISAENAEKNFSKGSEALSDEELSDEELSDVTGGAFYRYQGRMSEVENSSEE